MAMTEAELLSKVKNGLGITGTYQDEALRVHIDDVKMYMSDAGVKSETINSSASVGAVIRGVSDLWNYGSGNGKLSEYFTQRVIQLKYHEDNLESIEEIKFLCSIDMSQVSDSEKGQIILIKNTLYGIDIDATFILSENWYKDVYYEIGTIEDKNYWPTLDRILIGSLYGNEVEAAKQNFFKVTTDGKIYVYTDLNIMEGSTVRCIVSGVYM